MVMSLQLGQVLDGKYRIVRLIGEGGMGSVFEGQNTFISRRVAIKVLHANAAGNEAILKRFEREAQAAGRIGSDHILEVLDLGTLPDGDRYMVMEFLDGEELSARIERLGTIAARPLASLVRQTLVGLRAAHQAEIVHRDLKPDNIFILKEKAGHVDFVKIIDFGISKFSALSGDMSMTTTGAVMGTPFYMSPEQAKGAAGVDARTDLYAIGVIMYEALTGRVPFEGTSFNDLMFKIVLSDAPPLPDTVPADFQAIVQKAMARDPAARFQSADEFIAGIDHWLLSNGFSVRSSSASLDRMSMAGSGAGVGGLDRTAYGPGGTVSGASVSGGASGTKTKTGGAWAQTNGDAKTSSGSNTKVLVGLGAAVLVAAGSIFALVAGNRNSEESSQPAAQAASVPEKPLAAAQPAPVQPAPSPAPAPSVPAVAASPAAAEPEPEKVQPGQIEPVKVEPATAAAVKTEPAHPPVQPVVTSTPAKTKPTTTTAVSTSTQSTVQKKPAPAATTTKKPAATTTKKSSRDFGY